MLDHKAAPGNIGLEPEFSAPVGPNPLNTRTGFSAQFLLKELVWMELVQMQVTEPVADSLDAFSCPMLCREAVLHGHEDVFVPRRVLQQSSPSS